MLTAKEIMRKQYTGGISNARIIRYGKINSNLAYEIVQNNGAYPDGLEISHKKNQT